jgi:hypothetical protein
VKVLLDGQPAKDIQLMFVPDTKGLPISSALVLENGEAIVYTGADGREGAPAGKCRVVFTQMQENVGGGRGGTSGGRRRGGGNAASGKGDAAGKDESSADGAADEGERPRYGPNPAGPAPAVRPEPVGVPDMPAPLFPDEYATIETTPERVEIREEENFFEFRLPKR